MPRDFDAWPDEPEETDPEDRWGDPETEMVNVPSVRTPESDEDGDDEPVEIDRELATTFWAIVILVNVGVAGVSIGAMFVYFRGNYVLGGAAVFIGALALVRAYYSYRGYQAADDGTDSDGGDGSESGDDSADDDAIDEADDPDPADTEPPSGPAETAPPTDPAETDPAER